MRLNILTDTILATINPKEQTIKKIFENKRSYIQMALPSLRQKDKIEIGAIDKTQLKAIREKLAQAQQSKKK